MNRFFVSMLILIPLILFQNVMAHFVGKFFPLVNMIPILLVLWAWKLDMSTLVWVVCAGGVLRDFFVPDVVGFGPLTFAIVAFVARTQKTFLELYGYVFGMILVFTSTFLYLTIHRLAFLLRHEYWSWDLRLSSVLLMASLFNTLVSPFYFWALKPLYREPSHQGILLSNVHH